MNSQTKTVSIRLKNLCKSYVEGGQPHVILRGAGSEIIEGEMVALLGRSGSGKSTLLNLISGIDIADAGEVEIDGKVITSMSDRERTLFRRENIGFVYQFFNLIPTLSVGENLKLVMELNKAGEAEARCKELLDAVGLNDRYDSFPDKLSGGEQQRVAIARALIHKPSIILADEPTGNLDEETAQDIWRLLDTLVRPSGGTILLATHSMAAAKRCDRVLELVGGELHDITGKVD
ncbi:MAG: ABC transporter ATP-binding protein [Kordiimonadaceae bacterium]|nr:ABC transporter ATP-binding protein [Kordiimonadaceae bacterium]MBT6036561.1 ABC transporter ATP-binding protein [Kordiimonadaceae bacterium]MBT6329181.1 ABC transporter ATP-binding protein [Kordiimonadaceae bacterium]